MDGESPIHFYGNNEQWVGTDSTNYIAYNGEWRKVAYRWVGNKGKWYLTKMDDPQDTPVTITNGRYWEGTSYRGDMAFFGDGLQELPDPVLEGPDRFTGSQYKFYTSPTDTTENYVNFRAVSYNQNGTGDSELNEAGYITPFGIFGVFKRALCRKDKGHYFRTVTAPGQEGFNWGFGALVGTSSSQFYANAMAIQFRVPNAITEDQWLMYTGSEVLNSGTYYMGVLLKTDGSIVQCRYTQEGLKTITIPAIDGWKVNQWHTLYLRHNQQQTQWSMTLDPNKPNEFTVASAESGRLIGNQFDDVLFNAGPVHNNLLVAPANVYDRSVRGDVDLFRVYLVTADELSETNAPLWWQTPVFKLYANIGSKDGPQYDITDFAVDLPEVQDNRRFIMQNPDNIPEGTYWLSYETFRGRSNKVPIRLANAIARTTPLFCDFNNMGEIRENFFPANKQWGGTGVVGPNTVLLNGGVSRDNVEIFPNYKNSEEDVSGVLRCYANGAFYTGAVNGVDRRGEPVDRKTEVGACISTRDYLGPGSFRLKIRALNFDGCCNCCWTFHYEEIYENDKRWNEFLNYGDDGLHPQGNENDGYYIVRNNEIDIEWPTALKGSPNMENVSQKNARLNSWQGELRNWDVEDNPDDPAYFSEYTDVFQEWANEALNDGKWHTIGFDWHTNDPNPPISPITGQQLASKRVDFFIDDKFVLSIDTHIPDIPGRFWMGVWFPRASTNRWAGAQANYERDSFDIDWFSWTPFNETGVRTVSETYPNDVYYDWNFNNVKFNVVNTLPPSFVLRPPVNDSTPKLSNGEWTPGFVQFLGPRPPQLVGQNRLEFRYNLPGVTGGLAGEVRFNLPRNTAYTVKVKVISILNAGNGFDIIPFNNQSIVSVVNPVVGQTYEYNFTTPSNGYVNIRKRPTLYNFEGIIDVEFYY